MASLAGRTPDAHAAMATSTTQADGKWMIFTDIYVDNAEKPATERRLLTQFRHAAVFQTA
jgi:hypothetical protein